MTPDERKKLKSCKKSYKMEKIKKEVQELGVLKPDVFKGKLGTKGNIIKGDDNSSDHAVPNYIWTPILNAMRKLFPDFGYDETTIDLCCDESNSKFKVGLTENGSIGLTDELEGDSLQQDWNKLGFKYGWMAA